MGRLAFWRVRRQVEQERRRRALIAELLSIAELREGGDSQGCVLLEPGERIVFELHGAGLMEPRDVSPGTASTNREWSFGAPLPIGLRTTHSRTVSLPSNETPVVIDSGVFTVTDRRLVFQGSTRAREWRLTDLIGFRHDQRSPSTFFQIRRQDKPSGIRYEPGLRNHVDVALATAYAGDGPARQQLVAALLKEYDGHGDTVSPALLPTPPAAPSDGRTTPAAPLVKKAPAAYGANPLFRFGARALDAALIYGLCRLLRAPGFVNWLVYGFLYEVAVTPLLGATIGKRVFGLAVADRHTGERIGWPRLFVRAVVRTLWWVTGIGLVGDAIRVWTDTRPTLHDRLVGAAVVRFGRLEDG